MRTQKRAPAAASPPHWSHTVDLLDLVQERHDRPWTNDGVVLIAEVVPNLGGDQRVFLMNIAALRLTID